MHLIKVSYEQCRLDFFKEQLASAQRKLDWAVKHNPDCYAIAEKGDAVAFYMWAVEMAEKEVAEMQKVDTKICAVCGCPYVGASCPICGSREVEVEDDG